MMAVLLFGHTVRMEEPITVVPSYESAPARGAVSKGHTRAPTIQPKRLPVRSDPYPQAKSVTIETRLAQAGMTLRFVAEYPADLR